MLPRAICGFTVKSGQAASPDPANGAAGVDLAKILNWTPGFTGATHDIYFGTDQTGVTNASLLAGDLNRTGCVDWLDVEILAQSWLLDPTGTVPYAGVNSDTNVDFSDFALQAANWVTCTSSVFKNSQPGNTYSPTLAGDTTYYWRIDEVSGPLTIKGNVWSFSTPSSKANTPSPANAAAAVAIGSALSWTAGAGATSHDVYFGTANPPAFVGNQPAATYAPTLAATTTYYWRIDEINAGGTTTGDVWSFTTAAPVARDVDWINGSDRLWKNAANWSGGAVPTTLDKAAIRTGVANGPIVDSTTTAVAAECVVGDWSSVADNLTVTGGTLTLNRAGLLDNWLILGYQAVNNGTMTISGGTVSIPDPCGVMFVGFLGTGTLNMTGGLLDIGQAIGVADGVGSHGTVNLDGGTIIADGLNVGANGVVDINSGTLILRGDTRTAVNNLVSGGKLTAFNGLGSIAVDFNNVNPGNTTVTGTFAKASAPNPASGATGVLVNATLSWTPGMGAASHDVYFGTASPGTLQGNQTAATFDPGALAPATTYYWRIDEVDESNGVQTGTIWSFRTQETKAANPSPANNATGVATSIFLQWSPGYGATSHDVYFGSTNPPPFLETTDIEASDPGALAQGVTYFWRVDEVSGLGTVTGDLWQFQTQLPPPPANLRKGPYLIYPANNTQMSILFQLTATSSATIDWGTDTTYATGTMTTSEYGTDHQHRANITGLTPGTKYYYRVTIGSNNYTGNFNAAPAANATAVKFFMYGDTRTNPGQHNQVAQGMNAIYAGDPAYQTITLHAGDWVEGDAETTWTSQWFTNNSTTTDLYAFIKNVPLAGCIGNHEGGASIWRKYWPLPFQAADYFSFDYGPVHVAVVDMYNGGGYSSGSTQYNWLANDLATTTKQWKIVVFHEPGWSCNGGHPNNTTVQTQLQPLFVQYNVAIALAGHVHYYSRAVVSTVQHVTEGGGGAPAYNPAAGQPNVVTYSAGLSFLKVDVNGNTLTATTLRPDHVTVLDTFTLTH